MSAPLTVAEARAILLADEAFGMARRLKYGSEERAAWAKLVESAASRIATYEKPSVLRGVLESDAPYSPYDEGEPWKSLTTNKPYLVEVGEHVFEVTATAETGIHSGRRRFRVVCTTCACVVHKATTGPKHNIERHINEQARVSLGDAEPKETP